LVAITKDGGRFLATLTRLLLPSDPGIVAKLRNRLIVGIRTLIAAHPVKSIEYAGISGSTRSIHTRMKVVIASRFWRATLFITKIVAIACGSIVRLAIALRNLNTSPFGATTIVTWDIAWLWALGGLGWARAISVDF